MPVDGTTGCLRAFTQLKQQYSKLKVILSIGGGGKGSDNFALVAGSRSRTEVFCRTARQLVDMFGLDGVDSMPLPYHLHIYLRYTMNLPTANVASRLGTPLQPDRRQQLHPPPVRTPSSLPTPLRPRNLSPRKRMGTAQHRPRQSSQVSRPPKHNGLRFLRSLDKYIRAPR